MLTKNSKACSTTKWQNSFLDTCLPSEVSIGRSSSNFSGLSHNVPGAVDSEDVSSSSSACFEILACSSPFLFLTRYRKHRAKGFHNLYILGIQSISSITATYKGMFVPIPVEVLAHVLRFYMSSFCPGINELHLWGYSSVSEIFDPNYQRPELISCWPCYCNNPHHTCTIWWHEPCLLEAVYSQSAPEF